MFQKISPLLMQKLALQILNKDARQQARSIGHTPLIQKGESRIEIYQKVVSLTQKY